MTSAQISYMCGPALWYKVSPGLAGLNIKQYGIKGTNRGSKIIEETVRPCDSNSPLDLIVWKPTRSVCLEIDAYFFAELPSRFFEVQIYYVLYS